MSQPLPLVEQLKNLEQLQELDLKIDHLKKNKNGLPGTLKVLDDSLNKLKSSALAKKNAVTDIEKLQRQTQAAIELNTDRMSRSSGKLNNVHNSTEYQAANKEIDQLKKQSDSLSEQAKKASKDLELASAELKSIETEVEKIQAQRDSQAGVVSGQSAQLDSEISALMGERAKYTTKVEPRILSQYDRIRIARAGLGIVPAVGGRCKGCNMAIPPQLFNEIQKTTSIHSCPSCNRILFVPSPSQPAQSANQSQSA